MAGQKHNLPSEAHIELPEDPGPVRVLVHATRYQLVIKVMEALAKSKLPPSHFAGHNFQIETATMVVQWELKTYSFKMLRSTV